MPRELHGARPGREARPGRDEVAHTAGRQLCAARTLFTSELEAATDCCSTASMDAVLRPPNAQPARGTGTQLLT